jgi:hypothetical protein
MSEAPITKSQFSKMFGYWIIGITLKILPLPWRERIEVRGI